MKLLKSKSGFIGGAYVAAMVASVAMLGTLITLTAGLAQKVGVAQSNVNTGRTIDRLAEYILQNKVINIAQDPATQDQWLELPRMYYKRNQANPTDGDPPWNEQSQPGYLEPLLTTVDNATVDLRDTIGKDAFGNDFRICSINIQPANGTIAGNGRREIAPPTDLLRQPVFAIIGSGKNGQFENTLCVLIMNENIVSGTDDQIKLIKYGEVLEHQQSNRMALLHEGVPECAPNESLEYVTTTSEDGTPSSGWTCRNNYMGFVDQNFGSGGLRECLESERLALNNDGTLSCRMIDQLATNVPENVNMGRLAAGICHRGYTIGALESTASNTFLFRCQRLASYGDEAGPEAEMISIPLHERSCDFEVQNGQFKALYQSRDGTMRCLGMPTSLLTGSDCINKPYIMYDRGRIYCFPAANLAFETVQACLPNEILQFQTITNNTQCLPGVNQEPRNWIIPYSATHVACKTGDYIMHDGTNYICLDKIDFLTAVAPAASCDGHQMISWNEATKKFKCIQR